MTAPASPCPKRPARRRASAPCASRRCRAMPPRLRVPPAAGPLLAMNRAAEHLLRSLPECGVWARRWAHPSAPVAARARVSAAARRAAAPVRGAATDPPAPVGPGVAGALAGTEPTGSWLVVDASVRQADATHGPPRDAAAGADAAAAVAVAALAAARARGRAAVPRAAASEAVAATGPLAGVPLDVAGAQAGTSRTNARAARNTSAETAVAACERPGDTAVLAAAPASVPAAARVRAFAAARRAAASAREAATARPAPLLAEAAEALAGMAPMGSPEAVDASEQQAGTA